MSITEEVLRGLKSMVDIPIIPLNIYDILVTLEVSRPDILRLERLVIPLNIPDMSSTACVSKVVRSKSVIAAEEENI